MHGRPARIRFLGNLFKSSKVPGNRVMTALDAACAAGVAFEFHIYGDKYLEMVSRTPFNGRPWAVFHPMQPYEQSFEAIAHCDWLLLTLADSPNTRVTLHAKLPYYLALGKPILALVPDDSAVADVVREIGTGFVLGDEQAWARRLVEVLSDSKLVASVLRRNEQAIARYSWDSISRLWLEAFEVEETAAIPRPDEAAAAAIPG